MNRRELHVPISKIAQICIFQLKIFIATKNIRVFVNLPAHTNLVRSYLEHIIIDRTIIIRLTLVMHRPQIVTLSCEMCTISTNMT